MTSAKENNMRCTLFYSAFVLVGVLVAGDSPFSVRALALPEDKRDKEEPARKDEESLEKVKEFFAKFGKGDIPGVLDTMSADVDWFIPGPAAVPYAGQRKGREEVGKFFTSF